MYNVMASITTILIFIAAITAISGKPLDFGLDTDQPSARVLYRDEFLDTLSRLKLIAPEYDELDNMWKLWTKLDLLQPSPKTDTANTNSIVSQHGNHRERRQAPVNTRGADVGPHSVMSLTSSRHPSKVPRFPNGDVVDYNIINLEVLQWIRQQLIIKMMNRVEKSTVKNRN